MPSKPKTVLARPCYTLAVDGKHVDLTMYGQIVESWPVDWWTGEKIDGQFIVLKDFMADLDSIKDAETITIHMNSVGGDGYSAIAIHNVLRALPAEKTGIVEGVAMSGASLILCACEHTKAYANTLILWHHAWSYIWGAYNAPGIHKLAESLESMDKAQAEIYMRKTGKTFEEVMAIMDDEKSLTGREAHEMGLIDELLDDAEEEDLDIAVSADRQTLFVRGHGMRIAALGSLPEGIKTVETATGSGLDNILPEASGKTEGGTTMPQTLEELRKENPELANALFAEAQASANADAVNAERQRLADIDAIAGLYDDETVRAAKYGENACTAQELAYRAALETAKQGKQFLNDSRQDYQESNADNVGAAHASEDEDKPMTNADLFAAGKAAAEQALGKKKEA